MAQHVTDRARDPIVATIRYEKKNYSITKAGTIFVHYESGNYQTSEIREKTPCMRVMWRDSQRRRDIQEAFKGLDGMAKTYAGAFSAC